LVLLFVLDVNIIKNKNSKKTNKQANKQRSKYLFAVVLKFPVFINRCKPMFGNHLVGLFFIRTLNKFPLVHFDYLFIFYHLFSNSVAELDGIHEPES